MTSKEVLEDIKGYLLDREIQVLEELVNRDTPMKPLLVETDAANVHRYECLYCGATISIGGSIAYNKVFNVFCSKCGQRLDWSE